MALLTFGLHTTAGANTHTCSLTHIHTHSHTQTHMAFLTFGLHTTAGANTHSISSQYSHVVRNTSRVPWWACTQHDMQARQIGLPQIGFPDAIGFDEWER